MTLDKQSCDNCKFARDADHPEGGYDLECHRRPPGFVEKWPKILEDDWCGEWVIHPEVG